MKRTATSLILPLLICVGLTATDKADTAGGLRCELQPTSTQQLLATEPQSHLHFLLFSERDGLKVYADWNWWGYYARTFVLTDSASQNYEVTRRNPNVWDHNFPASVTINHGQVLVTDIYLCDGTWQASPKLAPKVFSVRMVGHYTLQARTDTSPMPTFYPLEDVWSGTIGSAPVELYLSKDCISRLNADHTK